MVDAMDMKLKQHGSGRVKMTEGINTAHTVPNTSRQRRSEAPRVLGTVVARDAR